MVSSLRPVTTLLIILVSVSIQAPLAMALMISDKSRSSVFAFTLGVEIQGAPDLGGRKAISNQAGPEVDDTNSSELHL
jgi:hypothetical protein